MKRIVEATLNTGRGLGHALRTEAAFREEAVVFLAALPVGWLIAPSVVWYVAMLSALLLVMAVELLNTAIEKLADHVTPERHPNIGRIKDYGSAAVACVLLLAGLVWLAALATRFGLI
ncbi:MAG: diacylglycerol kinase [Bradyrhizobiaceae bacterium]|nr:diacylglycerol kinase [Bradyrhizobiaceae bacterium]